MLPYGDCIVTVEVFEVTTFYQLSAQLNNGQDKPMKDFEGKVVLVVNTASQCGFTPQYKGLQALYEKYAERGLVVLAFPCNQFGHQEPGDEAKIREFCDLQFNISFPLFKKVEVNGNDTHPVFQYLKSSAPGLLGSESIKWNFTKFLVNRKGEVVERYAPTTKPEAIEKDIIALLNA